MDSINSFFGIFEFKGLSIIAYKLDIIVSKKNIPELTILLAKSSILPYIKCRYVQKKLILANPTEWYKKNYLKEFSIASKLFCKDLSTSTKSETALHAYNTVA